MSYQPKEQERVMRCQKCSKKVWDIRGKVR